MEFLTFSKFSDVRNQLTDYWFPPTFVAKVSQGTLRLTKLAEDEGGYLYEIALIPAPGSTRSPLVLEAVCSGFGTGGDADALGFAAKLATDYFNGRIVVPVYRH